MLELVAIGAVATTWLTCAFTALQLVELRARRSLVAMGVVLACGAAVVATRNGAVGFGWIRSVQLRSDVIALAVLPTAVATGAGALASRLSRTAAWAAPTVAVSALACAIAGIAGLAIGRSGWYWEFVAIVTGGLLLVAVGALTIARRDASANLRVVFGAAAMFGVFLVFGGTAMLAAWHSLA